jgi:hypothetical protein
MGSSSRQADVTLPIDLQCEWQLCVLVVDVALSPAHFVSDCFRYDDSVLANVRRLQAAYAPPKRAKSKRPKQ